MAVFTSYDTLAHDSGRTPRPWTHFSASAWKLCAHPAGMYKERWVFPWSSNESRRRNVGDLGRRSTTTSKMAPAEQRASLFSPAPTRTCSPRMTPVAARQAVLDERCRICENCLLVQLPTYIPSEDIFSDYAYLSSYSDSLVAHARGFVDNAPVLKTRCCLDQQAERAGTDRSHY